MSMFRTLQNSPATVSIFHNTKLASLQALYRKLLSAANTINEGDSKKSTKFIVDYMPDKLPTYDQFKFLVTRCVAGQEGRDVLTHAYPFMSSQKKPKESGSVTTHPPTGIDGHLRTFSEGEYAIVQEAFEHLLAEREEHPDHDPLEVFLAPLVVDWDQGLVAGDSTSLEHLLEKYRSTEIPAGASEATA